MSGEIGSRNKNSVQILFRKIELLFDSEIYFWMGGGERDWVRGMCGGARVEQFWVGLGFCSSQISRKMGLRQSAIWGELK